MRKTLWIGPLAMVSALLISIVIASCISCAVAKPILTFEQRVDLACQKLTFLLFAPERAGECKEGVLSSTLPQWEKERQTQCVERNNDLQSIGKCWKSIEL